ncbi:MAG: 3D-(3,5/4)-trihydroxycyclohexane-1,2-dione acylhydrolase (decyclizing), partial [Mycobacterium sp.]
GAAALRVSSIAALDAALVEAGHADRTTVIVVEVDPRRSVPNYGWWDVPVAEVSESPTVQAARSEYEQARQAER